MRDAAFKRDSFIKRNLTIIAPTLVFIVFFIIGGILFRNFFTLRVLLNLLTNNAFLGLAAVGMTVVIISGGIAAYKTPELVRRLKERGADVQVVYSARDALQIARAAPDREVVFLFLRKQRVALHISHVYRERISSGDAGAASQRASVRSPARVRALQLIR